MTVAPNISATAEVKPTNRLQRLRQLLDSDLDFAKSANGKGSRHSWHAFPAKFPPELPRLFIENLTDRGEIVLDPMAGSCTTLIEAAVAGRKAVGFDIDPLSLLVGAAKGSRFSVDHLKNTGHRVLRSAYARFKSRRSELKTQLTKRFDADDQAFLDYWFGRTLQLELLAILEQIEELPESPVRRVLLMLFSAIIITKSGGVTLARDLAHTRPHRVTDKKPRSAFTEFSNKLTRIAVDACEELAETVVLQQGDARELRMPADSVDLIVTSPPYANNAIDYMRAHKFSLVWFGHRITDLKGIRKSYIGSEGSTNVHVGSLPESVIRIVGELGKKRERKAESLARYYLEMKDVLKEMHRVLKPGRAAILVVASSVLMGVDVQTHRCLSEIGRAEGFDVVGIGQRRIHRDRRMMPSSHNGNQSGIEKRMHEEYVIGYWKS